MSAASRLLARVGGHRRWILASSALGIVTTSAGIALMGTATYLLTRSAFDTIGISLSLAILAVRASAVTRVVARYVDRYVGHLGTFEVLTRLRSWLYGTLASDDDRVIRARDRGAVVTALVDDVDTMQDHLLRVAVPPWVAVGTLAIAAIATAMIDPRAGLVAIVILAVSTVLLQVTQRRATSESEARLIDVRARRMALAAEFLDSLDELSVWDRTDVLTDRIAELDREDATIRRRVASSTAVHSAALSMAIAGAVIAATALVADRVDPMDRHWWIAALPVMVLAASDCLPAVLGAARAASSTERAAGHLLDLVGSKAPPSGETPTSLRPTTNDVQSGLVLDAVDLRHPGGPTILAGVDLRIEPGSVVWISGPSGVGKSSVVALLTGLLPPDAGTVTLDGVEVGSLDRSIHSPIAAALQHDHVFDSTIRDNLLVADGSASDARLDDAATLAGLREFLSERPGALDAATGADGSELSGGERRRLVLARAFTADAAVLVLDEPLEHLDPTRGRAILGSIIERRRDRITIVLTHEPPVGIPADLSLELRDGAFHRLDRDHDDPTG